MRKNTVISLTATLLAANISFAVPAFADDLQTYNLDTMVVTAQRESKRDVDTPASVTTVSQKQLVETGASNLFDALRLQSGVTTYSYGGSQSLGGMNAKILMRGANKGTVVMIDGVPANINETYYLDSIPVESIARVEIVKGAASTLYGSEASTGVINIITKKKMPNTLSLTKGEYGKKIQPIVYMVVNACHGFLFGTLYAPTQAILFGLSFKGMIAWIIAGLPWDFVHGISNFFCGILIVPIVTLLRKLEKQVG